MKALPLVLVVSASLLSAGCSSTKTPNVAGLPPGRLVKVGGYNLFLRQTGNGPDVVLLHGLGDSSIGWQFIEPGLREAGYRVLVWDALGAGRSERPAKADYSISAHVDRLEEMLVALEIREAVFVGHSLGGSEALLLAQRNPEKVRALCLIDPAAYRAGAMGGRWFWNMPLLAEAVLGVLPARTITRVGLRQNFHNREVISGELESMYLREAEREGAIAALMAQERQLVPKDPEKWEQAHRRIRKRTLILWGREDKLVPLAQGERLVKDIPEARLEVFPGAGHSPQLEAPQWVLDQILPFLKEISSQP
jgi:pimeloyl-ACP methyl ester carboxylesterase